LIDEGNIQDILGYLVDVAKGTSSWNEIKVLVLGQEVVHFLILNTK
jgi:F0F1-type ATP synthase assembly protein I